MWQIKASHAPSMWKLQITISFFVGLISSASGENIYFMYEDGGCGPGSQCGPWLPDGGTWDGSASWYCVANPALTAGAACDYSRKVLVWLFQWHCVVKNLWGRGPWNRVCYMVDPANTHFILCLTSNKFVFTSMSGIRHWWTKIFYQVGPCASGLSCCNGQCGSSSSPCVASTAAPTTAGSSGESGWSVRVLKNSFDAKYLKVTFFCFSF